MQHLHETAAAHVSGVQCWHLKGQERSFIQCFMRNTELYGLCLCLRMCGHAYCLLHTCHPRAWLYARHAERALACSLTYELAACLRVPCYLRCQSHGMACTHRVKGGHTYMQHHAVTCQALHGHQTAPGHSNCTRLCLHTVTGPP